MPWNNFFRVRADVRACGREGGGKAGSGRTGCQFQRWGRLRAVVPDKARRPGLRRSGPARQRGTACGTHRTTFVGGGKNSRLGSHAAAAWLDSKTSLEGHPMPATQPRARALVDPVAMPLIRSAVSARIQRRP